MSVTSTPLSVARLAPARAALAVPTAEAGHVSSTAALALSGAVTWMAFADGAYFPTTWGWSALGLAWICALALAVRPVVGVGRLEAAALSALLAFAAWTALSAVWSESVTRTSLETQRLLVYVTGVAAVLVSLRRRSVPLLLGGLLAGSTLVCGWAVLTRLVPDRIGVSYAIAGYRLAEPVGYWNALGAFAAMAALLALGLAARADGPLRRAAAGAALPLVLLTLYFTFSRGAWISFFVGLLAAAALDRRRLQLVTVAALAGGPAALAVGVASQSTALVSTDAPLEAAASEGHRMALILILLTVLAGAAAAGVARLERVRVSASLRRMYALLLVAGALGGLVVAFSQLGSPATIVRRAHGAFVAAPPRAGPDLNERLFSFSGANRPQLWQVAWKQVLEHPAAGTGAGTFELRWLQDRPVAAKRRDAHNLYLETFAELGAVGLVILIVALALPIAAGLAARRRPLVPAAFAAYTAFLVHAGVDWDWEVPAITLLALLSGAALLVSARAGRPFLLSPRARVGAVASAVLLAGLSFVGLAGNREVAAAENAAEEGRWADVAGHARAAARWAPWSSEPARLLADVATEQGDVATARRQLRAAIGKDPRRWLLWFELAAASEGRAQARALAQARMLNPRGREVAQLERDLRLDPSRMFRTPRWRTP